MGFVPPSIKEWLNPDLLQKRLHAERRSLKVFVGIGVVLCILAAVVPFLI